MEIAGHEFLHTICSLSVSDKAPGQSVRFGLFKSVLPVCFGTTLPPSRLSSLFFGNRKELDKQN